MHIQNLQKRVSDTFTKTFGRTPLKLRLEDINGEVNELCRFTDMTNLREEAGDALNSILALIDECGWDAENLSNENLAKIVRRSRQYNSLGRKLKVAILGGAFDPIHVGHIQIAKFVLNSSKTFDEVWLMPAYKHMNNKEMAPPEHRLAMCELAAATDGRIRVFNYEIKNKLSGETYHTCKRLLDEDFAKDQYDFSMIIGADNAHTFDSWVNYEELERLMRFVVVTRQGIDFKPDIPCWYIRPPHIYLNAEKSIVDMSSTLVREGFYNTKSRNGMHLGVDPQVERYILDNDLYIRKEDLMRSEIIKHMAHQAAEDLNLAKAKYNENKNKK